MIAVLCGDPCDSKSVGFTAPLDPWRALSRRRVRKRGNQWLSLTRHSPAIGFLSKKTWRWETASISHPLHFLFHRSMSSGHPTEGQASVLLCSFPAVIMHRPVETDDVRVLCTGKGRIARRQCFLHGPVSWTYLVTKNHIIVPVGVHCTAHSFASTSVTGQVQQEATTSLIWLFLDFWEEGALAVPPNSCPTLVTVAQSLSLLRFWFPHQ